MLKAFSIGAVGVGLIFGGSNLLTKGVQDIINWKNKKTPNPEQQTEAE